MLGMFARLPQQLQSRSNRTAGWGCAELGYHTERLLARQLVGLCGDHHEFGGQCGNDSGTKAVLPNPPSASIHTTPA